MPVPEAVRAEFLHYLVRRAPFARAQKLGRPTSPLAQSRPLAVAAYAARSAPTVTALTRRGLAAACCERRHSTAGARRPAVASRPVGGKGAPPGLSAGLGGARHACPQGDPRAILNSSGCALAS